MKPPPFACSVPGVVAGVTGAETEEEGAELVAGEADFVAEVVELVVTGNCIPGMGFAGGAKKWKYTLF